MFRKCQEHLEEQNESYFEHLIAAQKISLLLLLMSFSCFIHSIIPGWYTHCVSSKLFKLTAIVKRDK
jgi:uncharacterized ion transporter superfamily protein YfcC